SQIRKGSRLLLTTTATNARRSWRRRANDSPRTRVSLFGLQPRGAAANGGWPLPRVPGTGAAEPGPYPGPRGHYADGADIPKSPEGGLCQYNSRITSWMHLTAR